MNYTEMNDMKPRPVGFLSEGEISHDSEAFDYIRELHDYLWQFVRVFRPSASGSLDDFIDDALAVAKESKNGKIITIRSGEFFDASVEHLVIPSDMDVEYEKEAYDEWYEYAYRPSCNRIKYMSFSDWLRTRGARDTTDTEVLKFWEV